VRVFLQSYRLAVGSQTTVVRAPRATENFSDSYIIGSGGYGSVYKAQLGGRLVAVKKLHTSEEDMSDEKRFLSEIEVLMKIRHRSIIKLYGFCSHSRYKFLVCDSLIEETFTVSWKIRSLQRS
jgi:serine/threonine protein kinase